MARRKVTMLEAFQRSARESAERAAAERRRVIADREKEIRRAETARVAQEFSSRISQRAGDSVGSLIAGMRGAAGDHEDEVRGGVAPEDTLKGTLEGAPEAAAEDRVVPPALPAPQVSRGGPALPGFDRAVQPDLPDVKSLAAKETPVAVEHHAERPSSSAAPEPTGPHAEAAPSGAEVAAGSDDESPEEAPFQDTSPEEVDEAIAALEAEVFELPMSAKAFACLGLAALVATFVIGYSVGNRDLPAPDSTGSSGFVRAGYGRSAPAGGASTPRGGRSAEAASAGVQPLGSGSVPGLLAAGSSGRDGSRDAYRGADPAEAAGAASSGTASGHLAASDTAATGSAPALTAEDAYFQRDDMKFTILAITYSATEAHARLAMETYDSLYAKGFPAVHPIEKDSRLFLFVGAAETMGELEELRQQLKEVRSGQNRDSRPFRSAYLVNIDPYR